MVTIRHPTSHKWYGFPARALLFGAEAAAIHYNCISRVIAFSTNLTFGMPLAENMDDYGATILTILEDSALATIAEFCDLIGVKFKQTNKNGLMDRRNIPGSPGFLSGPS